MYIVQCIYVSRSEPTESESKSIAILMPKVELEWKQAMVKRQFVAALVASYFLHVCSYAMYKIRQTPLTPSSYHMKYLSERIAVKKL